jgi:hypothetical protein
MDIFEDYELYAEDATYYVGIFTDAEGNHPYGSDYMKEIHIQNASHSEPIVFSDLPDGTYYILETTEDGTPLVLDVESEVDGESFICELAEGTTNEVEISQKAKQLQGEVSLVNAYIDLPAGFAYRAAVDVTKNVVSVDGDTISTDDVFYAGIFTSETEETPMTVMALQNNGTVTIEVPLGGANGDEEVTYYVYETDENGQKIDQENFAYTISGEGSVTLNKTQNEQQITITNEAIETNVDENTEINGGEEIEEEPESEVENETQKDKSSDSSTTSTPKTVSQFVQAVSTGDATAMLVYFFLFAIAIAGIVVIVRRKKK